jgi:hypothetical protein
MTRLLSMPGLMLSASELFSINSRTFARDQRLDEATISAWWKNLSNVHRDIRTMEFRQ